MRVGATAERTRIVLELSSPRVGFKRTAEGDTALVLRLSGARLAAGFDLPAADGLYLDARAVPVRGGAVDLRIRFRAATAKVFRVARQKNVPDRIVVDLLPRPGSAVASDAGRATAGPSAATPPPAVDLPSPAADPGGTVAQPGPVSRGKRIVLIDAGHGGKDPGAVGKGIREKEVTLDVARRLAREIDGIPGLKAVLTRDDDRFIPLKDRMRAAEKAGADLFLSIHVNASPSRAADGAEVYFLSIGAASDQASRELARLENEADPDYVVEEDEGLQGIPFAVSLRQSDTLLRSSRAAEVVLETFGQAKLAEQRGVKQAGFAVLKSFQVPSALVELGFLSSAKDRENLKKPEHRQKLAEAIARGVSRYFQDYAPQRPSPADGTSEKPAEKPRRS